ncbi:hypothetical protein L2E82_30983 [Cichorium intybus]|uniref:Uncharacterized protein n=1 Tax=Cichorium intybus TaxID=13427 RepID=A0ACB9D293_CICIN|nr:hypothetical protein L2E82_30983 [Cichorium intybus]
MLSDHDENPRMLSDRDVIPVVPDTVFEEGFNAFNERNEEKRGKNVLVDEAIEVNDSPTTPKKLEGKDKLEEFKSYVCNKDESAFSINNLDSDFAKISQSKFLNGLPMEYPK